MYAVQLDETAGVDAETLMARLKERGIGTRAFFLGLHAQPILRKLGLFKGEQCPQTDRAHKFGLYLPSGLTLTKPQIDVVCDAVRETVQEV
jgi:perosamine synthetase